MLDFVPLCLGEDLSETDNSKDLIFFCMDIDDFGL